MSKLLTEQVSTHLPIQSLVCTEKANMGKNLGLVMLLIISLESAMLSFLCNT